MIFHLFNFFIHLPPSLASQTNLHLHPPQKPADHKRGPWPQPDFPVCASTHRPCVLPLSCCSLETEWELLWGERRQHSGRTGRRDKAGQGDFSLGWGHGWGPLSERELSLKTPLTSRYTHKTGSSYQGNLQQSLYGKITAQHRTVMWGHEGATREPRGGHEGATSVDSAAWMAMLKSAVLPDKWWKWLETV